MMWYDSFSGQYLQYNVNQCVEDSAEVGISVAALLSQVLYYDFVKFFLIEY